MAPRKRDLSTTAYVVLGLLSFGRELTGYELKQWADGSIVFFYASPATSQIYAELDRLEERGFVRSRDDSAGSDRARRTFRCTATGKTALRRWLGDEPVPPPTLKHSVALRIFFGHLIEPARLREILDEYAAQLTESLAALRRVRDELGDDDDWRNAALVADWGERFFKTELAAARKTAAEV